LLGAPDGECGHDHGAAALNASFHDVLEAVENFNVGVIAVAVGAFADEVIAGWRRRRVVIERSVVAADIAGEEDAEWRARAVDF
jgi:hypothetical protein